MVTITTSPRSERKPAVLWTPWGPIPKGGKGRLQVKSRWLPSAIGPAGAGRPGEAVGPRRGS
jgi:hypothetical protein